MTKSTEQLLGIHGLSEMIARAKAERMFEDARWHHSGLYTVNPQGHDPAELKAVALDIRNKAPEIYGLAIKFWTYFNAFGQAPSQ
jgi:hypothetical protein